MQPSTPGRAAGSKSAWRDGDEVELRVRDNGLGMSPEMLARVFDLFVQERHSLDRAQGGLGIGLTLVRRLVELHGGGVEAHSAGLEQGSEFIVHLPLAGAMIPDQVGTLDRDISPVAGAACLMAPSCRDIVRRDFADPRKSPGNERRTATSLVRS